jgi:hypothetical protein
VAELRLPDVADGKERPGLAERIAAEAPDDWDVASINVNLPHF